MALRCSEISFRCPCCQALVGSTERKNNLGGGVPASMQGHRRASSGTSVLPGSTTLCQGLVLSSSRWDRLPEF